LYLFRFNVIYLKIDFPFYYFLIDFRFYFISLFFGQSPIFFVPEPFRGIFVLSLQQQRNPTFSGINIIKCTVARQRSGRVKSIIAAAQTQFNFLFPKFLDQNRKNSKKRWTSHERSYTKKIPASSKTYKTSLIRNNNITQTKSSLIHTTFIKHNNNSEPSHKEGRRRTDSEPGSCTTTTRNRTNEGRKGNRLLSLCFLFDVFIFATSILDLVRSPHPFSKIISEMKQGRWEEEIGPKKI